ncbi:MAG: flagellar biosynthesis protein FlaG [Pseudomonadales bacterium]|nr:flagellar biosynthesis protein FlaG [Pseudomonadales bacterium]MAP76218.1 flagellar biosynthesis protein FlaG [Pseudomonadales bacterium]MCK5530156.1 flagellar protein FlaG [Halopseudomonas aestusnigri]
MDAAQNRSSSSEPVATQTRSAVGQSPEAEREKLQAAVSDIQGFVQSVRRDINFNLDEDSGRVVINVTEATSGDVIRQIPSEEALRLAENLSEIRSVLFEAEA